MATTKKKAAARSPKIPAETRLMLAAARWLIADNDAAENLDSEAAWETLQRIAGDLISAAAKYPPGRSAPARVALLARKAGRLQIELHRAKTAEGADDTSYKGRRSKHVEEELVAAWTALRGAAHPAVLA